MDRPLCDGVSTFHFDFHKNILCPKLSCQESYYASKLKTYAFGVHSGETGKGTTYVWPETVAPKHPDTLLSCLHLHLTEVEEKHRSWNIFWADNTRSQNKNYTVVMYFEHLIDSGFRRRIDYKYLSPGHSFGAVDRDAGRVESVLRREKTIETPSDYVKLINNSVLRPRIKWIEVKQHQFRCFSEWLRAKYIEHRKDVNKQPFLFSEIAHFNFGVGESVDPNDGELKTYSHKGHVWMRKTLDPREEPFELDLKRVRGRRNLDVADLVQLNSDDIVLTSKKREDLNMLSKFLSRSGKANYRNITDNQ